jgi:hypothetical protein
MVTVQDFAVVCANFNVAGVCMQEIVHTNGALNCIID